MKEHGILFNPTMVREILADRKTMTRRALQFQPMQGRVLSGNGRYLYDYESKKHKWYNMTEGLLKQNLLREVCPYKVGDILWVREAHNVKRYIVDYGFEITFKDGKVFKKMLPGTTGRNLYSRSSLDTDKFVPGMFMPKELTRLWLEVVSIKVEQLWDITDEDAQLEGIHFDQDSGYWYAGDLAQALSPTEAFNQLWVAINGLDSFDFNPWVFAIEFKIHKLLS